MLIVLAREIIVAASGNGKSHQNNQPMEMRSTVCGVVFQAKKGDL